MTGGEIFGAAGKAIGSAGKKFLDEDETSKKHLQKLAEGSPAMQAAADAYARRMAVKQEILLRLLKPLAHLFRVSRDYFEEEFAADMAVKTAEIPEEDLITPSPSVAIPAMAGLQYSLEHLELKEMYLNLLATATDGRRSKEAHPAFAEVIKQLSPDEARLLRSCFNKHTPIVKIVRWRGPGYSYLHTRLADLRDPRTGEQLDAELSAVYINNWIRLGLMEAIDKELGGKWHYEWARSSPAYVAAKANKKRFEHIRLESGDLVPTSFGERFARAVEIPIRDDCRWCDLRL
jgi:hypothetical protein